MVFKEGTSAFIVESNCLVREVVVLKRTGNFYIVRFANSNGGIRVRDSRLFATWEESREIRFNCKGKEKGIQISI
jgi:hypothetical protein